MTTARGPYIPEGVGEIMDQLGFMILKAPTFLDDMFPEQNVSSVFHQLNEGLRRTQRAIGSERLKTLLSLSDRARVHFEADTAYLGESARQGRLVLQEMQSLLTKKR